MSASNYSTTVLPKYETPALSQDGLGVILCIIIFCVAIFGRFLMLWHYQYMRILVRHKIGALENTEKNYRATVIHCDSSEFDHQWVLEILSKKLHRDGVLPMFLRGKDDFEAGRAEMDILVEAMEHSEKVIFILSPDFCQDKLLLYLWRIAVIMFSQEDIVLIELNPLSMEDLDSVPRSLKRLLKERLTLFGTQFQMSDNSPCVPFTNSEIELFRWPKKKRDRNLFWKSVYYSIHGRPYISRCEARKRSASWPLLFHVHKDVSQQRQMIKPNDMGDNKKLRTASYKRSFSYESPSSRSQNDIQDAPCHFIFENENLQSAITRL